MLKTQCIRSIGVFVFSFIFAVQTQAKVPVAQMELQEHISLAFAQQFASDYNQMKSVPEVMAYLLEGRSLEEKKEVLKLVKDVQDLPQVYMEEDQLIFSIDDLSISVDFRQAYKGRFTIEGLVITVDPKAPLKMQAEIIKKKLEAHLSPKHSLFSLLVPNAFAQTKGKANIIGKGGKTYHRALTAAELKALAEEEKKQNSLIKRIGASLSKHPFISVLVAGVAVKAVDSIQVGFVTGLWNQFCTKIDQSPTAEPTQNDVDSAFLCPTYVKNKKITLEKSRLEAEKKEAARKAELEKQQKEQKEKEEKQPSITAAKTAEDLKKDEIEGVKLTTVRKSCPHERKDGNIQSTVMKITEKGQGEEYIDVLWLEGTLENKQLKEVRVSEYHQKKKGRLLAIYKFEDSKFTKIAVPTKGRDRTKLAFEEFSAIEELPANHSRYNDQKLQKQINNKFQLSYLACADEEANAQGKKAAEAAGVKTLPAAPLKKEQTAGGAQ